MMTANVLPLPQREQPANDNAEADRSTSAVFLRFPVERARAVSPEQIIQQPVIPGPIR